MTTFSVAFYEFFSLGMWWWRGGGPRNRNKKKFAEIYEV
jgi:hypothetical protein